MATKKPKDTDAVKPKDADEDEDVLFEGELTWTHDPIPVSPEILKRTPRDQVPAKEEHHKAPAEGSVELHELREGGGEIFNVHEADLPDEPAPPAAEPESEPTADAPDEFPVDVPTADEEMAALEAEAAKTAPRSNSVVHDHTITPLNGFSKASLGDSDPFAEDRSAAPAPRVQRSAAGPVASEFAPEEDPTETQKGNRRQTITLIIIAAVVLLLGGAVAAYFLWWVPNRPESVLLRALSTTLQQPSVQVNAQISEQDAAKRPIMQTSVIGGLSQSGTYDLTTRLSNKNIPETPLTLSARSIDGRDSFVQATGLPQNMTYLSKIGMSPQAGPALQRLEGKWVRVPGELRQTIATDLGFDLKSANLGGQDKETLADIYSKNSFLNVARVLPDEAGGDQVRHHYQLSVDKTRLTSFMLAARGRVPSTGITQQHIDAANELDTRTLNLEVWIDSASSLISKIKAVQSKGAGNLNWEIGLSQYAESLALQQPTPTTDIIGALQTTIGPNASDADGQELLTKMLSYFSTNRPQ